MKRRTILVIIVCCIIGLCINFARIYFNHSYEFSDLFSEPIDSITEINILDGSSGEITTITDDNKIESIISSLSNIEYKNDKFIPQPSGCRYTVTIVTDQLNFSIIIFDDISCTIGDSDYSMKSNITSEIESYIS